MIVRLFCPQCIKMHKDALNENAVISIDVPVPIDRPQNDGLYEITCERNHESKIVVTNLKYDILFELGLNALLDENYRDAISNFTASLEKFYEFFCQVQLHYSGTDYEDIERIWKPLSKLSERQLGAYIIAYSSLTNKPTQLLNPNKEVKLRNDVIHNGYIPSANEAFKYGTSVSELMFKASYKLLEIAPESVTYVYDKLSPYTAPESPPTKEEFWDWTTGACNVITAMDIKLFDGSGRCILKHIERIKRERQPMRMDIGNGLKDSKYQEI
jgi:hypothetical protein